MAEEEKTLKTKDSPRWENGVLKWYVGNAFAVSFDISVEGLDEEDEPKVLVEFFDSKMNKKATFPKTPAWSIDGDKKTCQISLKIDKEKTKAFGPGLYTYCIKLKWTKNTGGTTPENRTRTIYGNGQVEVELCH